MADTTFTDGVTLTAAAWFQDLNDVYYKLTANRIPYATGTALTSSANLTFNGTTLTAHTLTVSTGALTAVSGTFSGTLTVTGAAAVGLDVRGTGRDRFQVENQGAGSGVNLYVLNNGATDYEPVVLAGESVALHYRTGVLTTAAGITLASTGAVTIPGTLGVTGAVTGESYLWGKAGIYPSAGGGSTSIIFSSSSGAGSATTYIGNAIITVVSDELTKRNIKPLEDGLSIIKALAPIEYDQDEARPWGDVEHYAGFGARHSHKIVPWAVNTQGATGEPWQMRQEFLMAPVVRAIQQLTEKVAALEARP